MFYYQMVPTKWKMLPFIIDVPIKHDTFPQLCHSLRLNPCKSHEKSGETTIFLLVLGIHQPPRCLMGTTMGFTAKGIQGPRLGPLTLVTGQPGATLTQFLTDLENDMVVSGTFGRPFCEMVFNS